MKRSDLLKHLRAHGCELLREGGRHLGGFTPRQTSAAPPRAIEKSTIIWHGRFAVIWVFPSRSSSNSALHPTIIPTFIARARLTGATISPCFSAWSQIGYTVAH